MRPRRKAAGKRLSGPTKETLEVRGISPNTSKEAAGFQLDGIVWEGGEWKFLQNLRERVLHNAPKAKNLDS